MSRARAVFVLHRDRMRAYGCGPPTLARHRKSHRCTASRSGPHHPGLGDMRRRDHLLSVDDLRQRPARSGYRDLRPVASLWFASRRDLFLIDRRAAASGFFSTDACRKTLNELVHGHRMGSLGRGDSRLANGLEDIGVVVDVDPAVPARTEGRPSGRGRRGLARRPYGHDFLFRRVRVELRLLQQLASGAHHGSAGPRKPHPDRSRTWRRIPANGTGPGEIAAYRQTFFRALVCAAATHCERRRYRRPRRGAGWR